MSRINSWILTEEENGVDLLEFQNEMNRLSEGWQEELDKDKEAQARFLDSLSDENRAF